MPVLAHVEVDLGHARQPDRMPGIDQQRHVDGVAAEERQRLQQLPPGGHLTGQRLAHRRELGVQQAEQRSGAQLGHPAAALGLRLAARRLERAGVEALGEGHRTGTGHHAGQRGRVMGAEAAGVGVQVDDHVAPQHGQRPPHRVALALDGSQLGTELGLDVHLGVERPGDLSGPVLGVVDDDDLVHDAAVDQRHQVIQDRADGGRLVAGGQTHGDRALAFGSHPLGGKGRVMEGPVLLPPFTGRLGHLSPGRSPRR